MKPKNLMFSTILAASLLVFAMAALPGAVAAFPDAGKAIRLVVPFAPGGNTDIIARAIGDELSKNLGVPVVIDNRPGGGGILGSTLVANAPADGHTILMVSASHVINPGMRKSLPYDTVRDFAAISLVADVPTVLVVHPSRPYKTLKELIAYARANPGRLNFSTAGHGTVGHLAGELMQSELGIKMKHIAYKGAGPALIDLLGGHVDLQFSSMPAALPHIEAGKLRALAVTAERRSAAAPDVPTTAEAGLPDFEISTGFGLFAPAKTPRSIIAKLNAEVIRALKMPHVRERLASQGAEPVGSTPEAYDAFVRREIAKWQKVIKEAGIQPE